jgi:glycosyltransferase involved in cell wall biosynthesis
MIISIIIPVYEVEPYLKRCLDSVVNQTYTDLEIILVDDGSPDRCGEICDSYAQLDSRIKVIHKKNEGLSEARNTGLKEIIHGDYVFFIDSDDYIEHHAVAVLADRAKKTKADLVIGNFIIVSEAGKMIHRDPFERDQLDQYSLMSSSEKFKFFFGKKYGAYGASVCNRLYNIEFLRSLNIKFENNEVVYPEDMLFNMKLYINDPKIELVNEHIYYYVMRPSSIVNSYRTNLVERFINFLVSFSKYADEQNKLRDNLDLIAYRAFSSVDGSGLNIYCHSQQKFKDMKREIVKYKVCDITNTAISNLARGKYLKEVPRKDWRYYAWVFSLLYSLNLLNAATMLQLLRFKLSP